jgi:hypothetical protein
MLSDAIFFNAVRSSFFSVSWYVLVVGGVDK